MGKNTVKAIGLVTLGKSLFLSGLPSIHLWTDAFELDYFKIHPGFLYSDKMN